uniref:F-ATPase delta subunit n=1 Tax=Timema douglasi TaxID=61478 RepID=A0A7R8Z840_TIMDO|nr:unnamed protein product [Timema douglasi]
MSIVKRGCSIFYDSKTVKQVDVPSFSGTFGILPKHVPTLAVLKPGVVTVFENDGSNQKIFVSSGTISINDDASVQVLAEEACPVDHIDLSAARDILNKAQSEFASATTEQAKAEAAIAIEGLFAAVSPKRRRNYDHEGIKHPVTRCPITFVAVPSEWSHVCKQMQLT